ncbi:hypothetical protein L915_10573 [Phytophthora nicotianae]|uniref:Uncharacterized protein n=1 Tax=Phytophthora nicotianae TaxID=4792 RepID=W2IWW7_PHYNI|nr:hypothetical protein L915_10573 [Phytophthora nicotianae]ETL37898.1 hypothetical protein L916_10465 [Phytophthora nicotianae]
MDTLHVFEVRSGCGQNLLVSTKNEVQEDGLDAASFLTELPGQSIVLY